MKRPLLIGMTGGIGSGKTTVGKIFACLGVPIFNSDSEAKMLMQTDTTLIQQIKAVFGEESYHENQLNKSYLAHLVFNDKNKLALLNSFVHPSVGTSNERLAIKAY